MSFDVKKARIIMIDRCMSLADVTRAAGLANNTLYKIMHGKSSASMKTVGRIAKVLGVPASELIKD